MQRTPQRRLMEELRERQRDLFKSVGPGAVVTAIGFFIAFWFVEPPPPKVVVIAAGTIDGSYYAVARSYKEVFARNGITLEIRETAGSTENYQLLLEDDTIQVAIVQGGTTPRDAKDAPIESIASLYLEPVWVFHRLNDKVTDLRQLAGKRIAVGSMGSGTHALAIELLNDNGIENEIDGTQLTTEGGRVAADNLKAGETDAIFLIGAPDAPVITELLHTPDIRLMSFERQNAYSRRYPFLRSVVLEQGVIDLENNLPSEHVKLIAPVANLVAHTKMHDAFIPLLLEAATARHNRGGLLVDADEFPSLRHVEFQPNKAARHYIGSGPSFFQKHLSFWVASLIDRTKIMLVPLAILLIPLIKLAPPVYRWRTRSRIYRWYGILREIDQKLRHGEFNQLATHFETLREMEHELEQLNVPLSYMEEFYQLRLHLDLVQRKLEQHRHEQSTKPVEESDQEGHEKPDHEGHSVE